MIASAVSGRSVMPARAIPDDITCGVAIATAERRSRVDGMRTSVPGFAAQRHAVTDATRADAEQLGDHNATGPIASAYRR